MKDKLQSLEDSFYNDIHVVENTTAPIKVSNRKITSKIMIKDENRSLVNKSLNLKQGETINSTTNYTDGLFLP